MAEAAPGKKLSGQVALVTGAGRRIGRAIALRLAAEGARVVVHYGRSKEQAIAVVAEIQSAGGEAFSCAGRTDAAGGDRAPVRRS